MTAPLHRVYLFIFSLAGLAVWGIPVCGQAAQPLKAMPITGGATLSLGADFRLLYDSYDNGQLVSGNDYEQALLRAVIGAELRWNPRFRLFSEIGTGQVEGRRSSAGANLQNESSLQQLFAELSGRIGSASVGAVIGRQEFADGPRQLLSVSDGSTLHRTWNGVRLYAKGKKIGLGAFDLRVTRLGRGSFDERINHAERLQGLNASLVVSTGPKGKGADITLEPFWLHTENPAFRSGGSTGYDRRDTLGARLRGQRGGLSFDWTLAHQTGAFMDRGVDAWGLFAVQSLVISEAGWKPRLTAHVDLATGGGAYGTGTLRAFNPLYASSGYLGEGRFVSLSNLLLIAPGISATPTPRLKLSAEYGFARRLDANDAAYGGGTRAYAGTQNVPGRDIGGLLRLAGSFSATKQLTLLLGFERLFAGDVLRRVQLPSGSYRSVGVSFKY